MAPQPHYSVHRDHIYGDAPPSYEEVVRLNHEKAPFHPSNPWAKSAQSPARDSLSAVSARPYTDSHFSPATSRETLPSPSHPDLPVVIPQVTKTFGGAFASPFVRAYAPSLASFSCPQSHHPGHHTGPIDSTTFLAFLDGLNEAFIGSPAWKALNLVGTGMSFVPMLSVSAAGGGLSLAAGLGSAATSYFRTVAYVKAANETLFHPAGLQVTVKSTKDMMAMVGVDGDRLQLPPLDVMPAHASDAAYTPHMSSETSADDPRMRRLRALGSNVAQLTFDVPAPAAQSNWLKKMGDWEAQRTCRKQHEKMMEKRSKAAGKQKVFKADQDVAKVQQEMEKVDSKARRDTEKHGHRHHGREAEKIEKDRQHEMRKLEREMEKALRKLDRKNEKLERKREKGKDSDDQDKVEKKEQKVAQKIRWVVITKFDGNVLNTHDEEDNVSDSE